MAPLRLASLALGFALALVGSLHEVSAESAEGPWDLPDPGDCDERVLSDAAGPLPPAPGRTIERARLAELESWLAPELWTARERLLAAETVKIGPCFRPYRPPELFLAATRLHAGRAKLREDGGIEGTAAGLPFPPETIQAGAGDAGQRWAWNTAHRWQGGGRYADVRVSWFGRDDVAGFVEGEHFVARLLGRADLPASGYKLPWAKRTRFVAGGNLRDPATGRRCAYRQLRSADAEIGGGRADDVFFWSSGLRRAERVGWDPEQPMLACAYSRGLHLARGGRIDRYRWKVAGIRDLLFPINLGNAPPGQPADPASLGAVSLELRRTLVLEAAVGSSQIRRYFDLETLFPLLLVVTNGAARTLQLDAGRWSGDRADYPALGDVPGPEVRVVDPVLRIELWGTEGMRIDAWETTAAPPPRMNLRREVSSGALTGER